MPNKLSFLIFLGINYLLTSAYSIDSQNIRPEIMAFVDSMSNEECVRLFRPKKYFDTFQNSVLLDELKILIHHNSPIVRVYSFWALSSKDYNQSFDVLIKNINNRNILCYPSHDTEISFEGYLYYRIWNKNHKPTENQRNIIDSLIIHNETAIPLFEALNNFKPDKSHYNRIKELTLSQDYINRYTVIALAKYHCKEDVPIILKFIDNEETKSHAFVAIAEFPDISFYNILKSFLSKEIEDRHFYHGRINSLCEALVQYPTIETVDFLKGIRRKTRFHKRKVFDEALWKALEKYPNDIFNPLRSKLEMPY